MKISGTLAVIAILSFTSCCSNRQECNDATKKLGHTPSAYPLIGRTGVMTFPDLKVETNFISDSTMHWKTTNSKGEVNEGDEKVSYSEVAADLYFLNWIEENGYVISQIINTKDGKVKAYWSYHDEKSTRAKRSAVFTDGSFEFVK